MLTIEEIKRCIEEFKPEGFRVEPNFGGFRLSYLDGSYFTLVKKDNDRRELLYPLFLQRVKRGINKHCTSNYRIDILGVNLFVVDEITSITVDTHKYYYDNDEGLEQAIKYILTK